MDDSKIAELIAEHYQKTYELTFELWKERNRIFLVLLGVIGIATLLTFQTTETAPLIVHFAAKLLGVTDPQEVSELRDSFPLGLLQSILLIVVFYLMVNLYHRSLYVLRNYSYLARLEAEIQRHLNLPKGAVSFTREGKYYWGRRGFLQGVVKWTYMLMLGALLIVFLAGRIYNDFQIGNKLLASVETAIAVATMIYYFAYAKSSISLDISEAVVVRDESGLVESINDKGRKGDL